MKDFRLDREPKINTGFATPEGYFDAFDEKLMKKLPVHEPKVIPFFAKHRSWIMGVAAVLVLALTIPFYTTIDQGEAEIDTASMENYLTYQSNISQYELIQLLDNEDIQDLNMNLALEDKTIENILTTTTNFENYIYEN